MSTKSRSVGVRSRRGCDRQQPPSWAEADDELSVPEPAVGGRASHRAVEHDDLRQLAARRKLEQYLESKRLREHLQEIYFDEEY